MLQENPDMTQREIAEKLGLSASGMNYCLKALIEKGWVKVQNFSQSKNKFGYIYVLTPQGILEKTSLRFSLSSCAAGQERAFGRSAARVFPSSSFRLSTTRACSSSR